MAAGDLVVVDYQYEYNGLVIGAETPFDLLKVDNLIGYPTARSGTVELFGRHGGSAGRIFANVRKPSFDGRVVGVDNADFASVRSQFMEAFAIITEPEGELPLVFQHPGAGKLRLYCRPIDVNMPIDRKFALKYPTFQARFEASDPLVYSNDEHQVLMTLPIASGGLTFPLSFPLVFGSGVSGTTSVTNAGDVGAPWRAILSGPAQNPIILNDTTGQTLELNGVSVNAGETLVYDSATSSISLNNVASRTGFLTSASSWWDLEPRVATDLRYSATGADTSSMTFYWRDAYWGN